MIIKVTTVNQVQKSLRLSLCKGEIYMSLNDVVNIAALEDRLKINDNDTIKKITSIIGEDNFKLIYFTDNFNPLYIKDSLYTPFISYNGLKKLIEYPDLDEYFIKLDLARINDFITKDKKVILETLSNEEFNIDMYVVRKTQKKETDKTHENEKENNMNELELLNIEIDDDSHSIQYFKSKKDKLWFSLKDIYSIIYIYYNRISLSDTIDFCKKAGKINVCSSHSMYRTSDGEDIYIKELDYYPVFIDFSTIDKLSKKYSDIIAYNKLDKIKDAIRDNFEELRIEITKEEIEKRIEAVKKEIDDIWELQQTINKNKKK